jgi:hypothetical protein
MKVTDLSPMSTVKSLSRDTQTQRMLLDLELIMNPSVIARRRELSVSLDHVNKRNIAESKCTQ